MNEQHPPEEATAEEAEAIASEEIVADEEALADEPADPWAAFFAQQLIDLAGDLAAVHVCYKDAMEEHHTVKNCAASPGARYPLVLGVLAGFLHGRAVCHDAACLTRRNFSFVGFVVRTLDLQQFVQVLNNEYGITDTDSGVFLARIACFHLSQGGQVPRELPTKLEIRHALYGILRHRPRA